MSTGNFKTVICTYFSDSWRNVSVEFGNAIPFCVRGDKDSALNFAVNYDLLQDDFVIDLYVIAVGKDRLLRLDGKER